FSRRGAREREPAPPRNPSDALAVRCSFPTWIVERWTKRYGREDAESLMRALNERPPLTLRANRLRITRDALGQRLAEEAAAARLGISIIDTHDGLVESLAPSFRAACDGVLVDAPCSNLGVLRRNPEVKWRRQPSDLALASRRQSEILDAAATMVRPGGRLVY